ncbi:MAG: hypothetical protein NT085_05195 [candidate division SR1 bacterium]|nr:hypothetical protein [candidate division SR1 bacterium]
MKNLLVNYCTAVLGSSSFIQNNFLYDAKQSAFVHLLCRNMNMPSPYFKDDYFKRTSFADLGFTDITVDTIDLCNPSSFDNDCDLSVNIPNLFNSIMNDYVNMKQPNLYGMIAESDKDDDMKNQINIFSSGYFDGVQICGANETRYPTTCKMMQGYIKNVRNVLSDVSIFSTTGVLEMSKLKAKTVSCDSITETTDIFYCGLYGEKGAKLTSFVNLAYNELFYYRLFMGYYLSMIQTYPSLITNNTYMTDYNYILKTFSTQYMWSKDALSLSLKMMAGTYMAFPFHVGFSMYQEDLDGFGKAVARIAPPIYTLYDKLRNVQKP